MDKIKKQTLFDYLDAANLLEYGMAFPKELVQEYLGLEHQEFMTIEQFTNNACKELEAIDPVRVKLLSKGMYLGSDHGNYRVYLPSENAKQINSYLKSAKKKTSRSLILAKNTPEIDGNNDNGISTHIIQARLASIKEQLAHNLILR